MLIDIIWWCAIKILVSVSCIGNSLDIVSKWRGMLMTKGVLAEWHLIFLKAFVVGSLSPILSLFAE